MFKKIVFFFSKYYVINSGHDLEKLFKLEKSNW